MLDSRRITPNELKRRMDAGEQFTFVDVRNPHAWAESDVLMPGAIRIPTDKLDQHLSQIPKDKPVVAYCT